MAPLADEYDFERLAREIVSSRLADVEKAPEAAAEIAKRILITGVQSTKVRQDPHATVSAVCRGVIGGMFLLNKDLPETAVRLLALIPDIAHQLPLEPGDLMTWAMEGVAEASATAGVQAQNAIQMRIEERFHGAGAVFSELCSRRPSQ